VLRDYLKDQLPEYLRPGAWVLLDQIPLTASGKIDKRALPAASVSGEADQYIAPRTETEQVLAGIWMALLGSDRVGVHDHFFERGGHSLLATRVVSRIADRFQIELPVGAVFDAPTLEQLAARIDLEIPVQRAQEESLMESLSVELQREIEGLSEEEVQKRVAELERGLSAGQMADGV
jgi:acyl carrier protein